MVSPIVYIIVAIIIVVPLWKIFRKAGFNPALSLLVLIPFFGMLITTVILAFVTWPVIKSSEKN